LLQRVEAHADDSGCIYCTSWPEFCTGLESANLAEFKIMYDEWECDASYAAKSAAEAAKTAQEAALVASELAIKAAIKAQEARDAAGEALQAADEARLMAESLQRARTAVDELSARVSLQRRR
jgi:hypothetical protein